MNKLNKIIGGVGAALGILIAITPFQLVPVCQKLLELKTGKMVHMRCHYTGQAEVLLGIAITIISLFILFNKNLPVRKSLGGVLVVLGIVVILLPTNLGIGVCMMPMACHTTAKLLYAWGGLLIIDGLLALFYKGASINVAGEGKQEEV